MNTNKSTKQNELYTKFKNEYLKPYLEEDAEKNPFPHYNVSDIKYAAKYQDTEQEEKLSKLFQKINDPANKINRKQLIQQYYLSMDRKYNDQTVDPDMPKPEKVGICVDKIVSNGVQEIALHVTGKSQTIYPYMVAGTSTIAPKYGDTMLDVVELSRVNVLAPSYTVYHFSPSGAPQKSTVPAGFMESMNDGWTITGDFIRGTPTGVVSEIATANTANYETSKIFDRSVLSLHDRIIHEQNHDKFTLSVFYTVTSI